MTEDKLMPLAAKMVDLLKSDQEQKLIKDKKLLNKVKELKDRLNEFEESNLTIN